MSIEMRSIRCFRGRATNVPCANPAVVEVLGPEPYLLCAEHAASELSAGPELAHEEGWEEFGVEEYARYCERAADFFAGALGASGGENPADDNPVVALILEGSVNYLELYELKRARRVLEARGGRCRETVREREFREAVERLTRKTSPEGVHSAINGLLSRSADLLEESGAPAGARAEEERKARDAIAEAGLIISRLSRAASEEAAEPESGAGSEASCA